jgi:Rps23 Pro-64 3,4-dihydroxylase Tpa1-like proline 4-hydroxylase
MTTGLFPNNILAGAIAVYENVIDNYEESINTVNLLANNDSLEIEFKDATVLGTAEGYSVRTPVRSPARTNSHLYISSDYNIEQLTELENLYNDIIFTRLQSYKEKFGITEDVYNPENFQLLKYEVGQYFHSHYDSYPSVNRVISVLIYLNDDYEGGEIEFVNFDIKIKPKAGTLIMFPSNYPYRHIAHPVISGTKYAVSTFLHER